MAATRLPTTAEASPAGWTDGAFFCHSSGMGIGYFCPKRKTMLTLQYLKTILLNDGHPELDGIDQENRIFEVRAGMGGAIETIQNKNLPVCLVLEHPERHVLSLRNMGGFHECTLSIWVMEMVARNERPEDVMERCYKRIERLYTVLVGHIDDPQLKGWIENNEMSAYDREAGSYVGYEAFVNFRDNKDLSYVARSQQ